MTPTCRSCKHYNWADLICYTRRRDTRPEFPACQQYERHAKWGPDATVSTYEVLSAHIDEGLSIPEVADRFGLRREQVSGRFITAFQAGRIRRVGRGRYEWAQGSQKKRRRGA